MYQSCLTKTVQTESRIKLVLIMPRCSLFYVKHNAEDWYNLEVTKSLPTTFYHSIRYLCINQIWNNCLFVAKIVKF